MTGHFVPAHVIVQAPGAAPIRTALLAHGILGSLRNWRAFARRIVERWPAWRVVLVDLRGHGDSHDAPPPHTLAACASDLAGLLADPELVIGHSFGGKVALTYARDHGEGLREVWVLDAAPGPIREADETQAARDPAHDPAGDPAHDPAHDPALDPTNDMAWIFATLRAFPQPAPSRAALVEHLEAAGLGRDFAGWMTTNLRRAHDGLRWRFDLDAASEMLRDFFAADLWPALTAPRPGVTFHMVRAERSDRWPPGALARLAALPAVRLHTLRDAGHWVHADNPDGLLELLELGFG